MGGLGARGVFGGKDWATAAWGLDMRGLWYGGYRELTCLVEIWHLFEMGYWNKGVLTGNGEMSSEIRTTMLNRNARIVTSHMTPNDV